MTPLPTPTCLASLSQFSNVAPSILTYLGSSQSLRHGDLNS